MALWHGCNVHIVHVLHCDGICKKVMSVAHSIGWFNFFLFADMIKIAQLCRERPEFLAFEGHKGRKAKKLNFIQFPRKVCLPKSLLCHLLFQVCTTNFNYLVNICIFFLSIINKLWQISSQLVLVPNHSNIFGDPSLLCTRILAQTISAPCT